MDGNAPRPKTKDVARRTSEMVKPGEIIGIAGMEGWSLADRRTWNTLLMNAWDERLEDPEADFTIPLRELRGLHDSNDRIKQSLEKLQTTLVSARMPDGALRTVQMLGGTDISDSDREHGLLKYDFHRKLVPLLRESEIYARMNLKVMSAFTSKYSLALYEAISARIEMRKQSEEISVKEFREWLGVGDDKLSIWGNFSKFAVQPALREVNSLSPYDVAIEPIKKGRKIEKVRVSWAKKEPFSPEEQKAAREVNRPRVGRKSRIDNTAETVVAANIQLSSNALQKAYDAAAEICPIDIDIAYRDWLGMIENFDEKPGNPTGHFIAFCKKRAKDIS